MTNRTVLNGLCPVPFLQEDLFPSTGGCTAPLIIAGLLLWTLADRVGFCLLVIGGRYCQPVGDISCCLPCPIAAWTYGDGKLTLCACLSCRVAVSL
jgi:hypothetical protein